MRVVTEAYGVLGNERKRTMYLAQIRKCDYLTVRSLFHHRLLLDALQLEEATRVQRTAANEFIKTYHVRATMHMIHILVAQVDAAGSEEPNACRNR